jgi:hypothetical protein
VKTWLVRWALLKGHDGQETSKTHLHDGASRRDLLAVRDPIRRGWIVDLSLASTRHRTIRVNTIRLWRESKGTGKGVESNGPRVEDSKDDGEDDRGDNDHQLEDGVSEEMGTFGVVSVEVPDLNRATRYYGPAWVTR